MPTKSDRPEELIEVVRRLRRWTSDQDSDAFLIQGSFVHLGADVEAAAVSARVLIQDAANAVFALVSALERTAEYKRQVKDLQHGPDSAIRRG